MEQIKLKDANVGDVVQVIYRDHPPRYSVLSRVEEVFFGEVLLKPLIPRLDTAYNTYTYEPYVEWTQQFKGWTQARRYTEEEVQARRYTEEEVRELILAYELQR